MRNMNILTSPEPSEEEDSIHSEDALEEEPIEPDDQPEGEASILNEVRDEWNISIKFKQLDLEMRNLIDKHSWNNDIDREGQINYDNIRRRHSLLPKNPRKELEDMLKKFEEDERNGFSIGMPCPVRVLDQEQSNIEEEKQIESENRIEAIFAKYKIRDFSDQDKQNPKERPVEQGDILEEKSNRCSIANHEQQVLEEKKSSSGDVEENMEFEEMHSNVEKIMNECLNSQKLSPMNLEEDSDSKNEEELQMDLNDWDNNDLIVKTSRDEGNYSNILNELEESVRKEGSFLQGSNFLDVKESINKIKLGQSDLFSKEREFSPIIKKDLGLLKLIYLDIRLF